MCQLLGMNCNTPTDIVFSFEGFRRRTGLTDCHCDGFGIAFFEGKGIRVFRDNQAAILLPLLIVLSSIILNHSMSSHIFVKPHKVK